MKVEIEIPDEFVVDYKNDKFEDFFKRVLSDIENGLFCGIYEKEIAEMFINSFSESKVKNKEINFVKEAYNNGLEDAWMLARRICGLVDEINDNLKEEEVEKIFNSISCRVINEYSYDEALAKLEIYEKEQNEIKLGDIIICCDKEGVVTKVDDNYFNIVYKDGSSDKISQIICKKKTGKHIDIQSLLKQIGDVE